MAGARNILLTGRPGVGKTTLLRAVLSRTPLRAQGFFTQEIREGGRRVGFEIRSICGNRGVLAHVGISSQARVGPYGVNVEDIRRVGVAALEEALRGAELIVCDEIGRMEMHCPEFCEVIQRCLDSPTPLLGVLQARRDEFPDRIRRRSDVDLVVVTLQNRDALVDDLLGRLSALVRSSRCGLPQRCQPERSACPAREESCCCSSHDSRPLPRARIAWERGI